MHKNIYVCNNRSVTAVCEKLLMNMAAFIPKDESLGDILVGDQLSCSLHVQTGISEKLKLRDASHCFHERLDLRIPVVCHCLNNHKDSFCVKMLN